MRVLDNVEDCWLRNPEVPANDGVVPAAGDEGAPWRHGQALHAPLVLRHFGRPNSAQLLSRYVWLHGKDTLLDISLVTTYLNSILHFTFKASGVVDLPTGGFSGVLSK